MDQKLNILQVRGLEEIKKIVAEEILKMPNEKFLELSDPTLFSIFDKNLEFTEADRKSIARIKKKINIEKIIDVVLENAQKEKPTRKKLLKAIDKLFKSM